MTWATALAWALKHWKLAAFLALGAFCAIQHGELRHKDKVIAGKEAALKIERDGRKADLLAYRAASEKARADAEAAARATEQHYATIQKEQSDALHVQLADARALAARYASVHKAPAADPGLSGKADLPGAPGAAAGAAGLGEQAVLVTAGDLDTCTVNTVKAEQWREWWLKVSADSAK